MAPLSWSISRGNPITSEPRAAFKKSVGVEDLAKELAADRWAQLLRTVSRNIDMLVSGSGHHSVRVAYWAEAIAQALGLPEADIQVICWSALLHDVGKIALPESILKKKGPLTKTEWAYMELHPEIGANMLRANPLSAMLAPIVLAHQEKFNGQGYPQGLQGKDIPLGARILAVADAYDAMIDDRPYHTPLSREAALAEIRRSSGQHFDPLVVDVFCSILGARFVTPQRVM